MRRNPNHLNYFRNSENNVEVVPAPPTAEPEIIVASVQPVVEEEVEVIELTSKYLYSLPKEEQVEFLLGLGLGYKEINKLKYERDRVNKILELQE